MTREFSFSNPVFAQYAFHAGVSILKTILMSGITIKHRLSRKVVANTEDVLEKGKEPIFNDPIVERTRRCHRNDLENVIPFVLTGALYVLTDPDPWWAAFHFRFFTFSRICHTIVYIYAVPQPARASMFGIGWIIIASMCVAVLRCGKL